MKKYRVYRSLGKLDKAVRKHELIAVEYGENVFDATDRLIKAVSDDAGSLEKYRNGNWRASAYAPMPVESFRNVKRYDYEMTAILYPDFGEKNDLIEYGIIEEGISEGS